MSENAMQSNPPEAEGEKIIVLLLPQALGNKANSAQLYKTLKSSGHVRVLLCLTDPTGDVAADARVDELVKALKGAVAELAEAGHDIKVQILLGPKADEPAIDADVVLKAHRTSSEEPNVVKDHTEFALALSDVVLLAPEFIPLTSATLSKQSPELKKFLRTVEDLGKLKVEPGDPLPALPSLTDVTLGLDPERPGWFRGPRYYFWVGRLEQFALELFASRWCNLKTAWDSFKRLAKCLDAERRPGSYFAPKGWQKDAPDKEARDSSRIIACFNALDRSAVYGSQKHRDFVWMEYLGAAVAVLLAVAGYVNKGPPAWGFGELAVLLLVGFLVLYSRITRLQDRWTACRLGAEQLRIALMSLPLLVLPEALATREVQAAAPRGDRHETETKVDFCALQLVKRAVRQHGLPRLDQEKFKSPQAIAWLRLIIGDQIEYHERNHSKLDRAESGLRTVSQLIFLSAIVAVLGHLYAEFKHAHAEILDWLLLVTAAAPAFAAALHETGTHLGIVHRIALSEQTMSELKRIDDELGRSIQAEDPWTKIRQLTYKATEIMGAENTSWHGLVRRYRDDL
jgi:hypothetical protein